MVSGRLWGLIMCHSYGRYGMRVSFPVRQMLRLLSQSISRNVERLSYAQLLHTRKMVYSDVERWRILSHGSSLQVDAMPTESCGYIISNVDDLLGLFDADFGVLVVGEAAKILGPNDCEEVMIVARYLRDKSFE